MEFFRTKKVTVGDHAPDFTLLNQAGAPVSLHDFHGTRNIVLYFYPKDNTQICTAEACSFRDSYEVFRDAGAEVIGVSSDTTESHSQFAGQHRLPFSILADTNNRVNQLYGVPKKLGLLPGRVTYVIDMEGIVRHIFSAQLHAERHITEALAALKAISGSTRIS